MHFSILNPILNMKGKKKRKWQRAWHFSKSISNMAAKDTGQSANPRPLHFDWQCHICKRVMNHKTRVKGKLTQQLTGDWYIELEVFNLAAELTWSLYNKLQCLQGNTSPDGSPSAFPSFLLRLSCTRDLLVSLEYRLQLVCSLNMIKMDVLSAGVEL